MKIFKSLTICLLFICTLLVSSFFFSCCNPNTQPSEPQPPQETTPVDTFDANFSLPGDLLIHPLFYSLDINYTNGHFTTNLELNKYKNNGPSTYYISPLGNDANSGLSIDEPLFSVEKAYSLCESGDTIYLLDGIYKLENWFTTLAINRSINIIGQSANVFVTSSNNQTFTKVSGYENLYKTTFNSTILNCLDISDCQNIFKLTTASTAIDCAKSANTYFLKNKTLYVNMGGKVPTNENFVINTNNNNALLNINNLQENAKLYFENLTILGGEKGNLVAVGSKNYTPLIMAKNCRFLFAGSLDSLVNAVSIRAADSIFQNCEASHASLDGFNYHIASKINCYAIEVDCLAHSNGINTPVDSCNGSSMHDGGKILRVNGEYYNNAGGNVVDVSDKTISVNLGCYAHDSAAILVKNSNINFANQNTGCEMYLIGCKAKGSLYDISSGENSFVYIKDCNFDSEKFTGLGHKIYL